ncbi:hypothetical protein DER45DRAFT_96043 [Fusarium avenaceum]|nr:hypothetical protein DER45DRAFT_96043 [Fusarium avenaceum]
MSPISLEFLSRFSGLTPMARWLLSLLFSSLSTPHRTMTQPIVNKHVVNSNHTETNPQLTAVDEGRNRGKRKGGDGHICFLTSPGQRGNICCDPKSQHRAQPCNSWHQSLHLHNVPSPQPI